MKYRIIYNSSVYNLHFGLDKNLSIHFVANPHTGGLILKFSLKMARNITRPYCNLRQHINIISTSI
jgi:hypothetical protein